MLLVHLSCCKHNYHAKFHLSCWSGSTSYQPFSLGTRINRQGNVIAPAGRDRVHRQERSVAFQPRPWQFSEQAGGSCSPLSLGYVIFELGVQRIWHCLFVSLVDFMFSRNPLLLTSLPDRANALQVSRLMELLQREQAATGFTVIMTLYQYHKSPPCHRQQATPTSTWHHF